VSTDHGDLGSRVEGGKKEDKRCWLRGITKVLDINGRAQLQGHNMLGSQFFLSGLQSKPWYRRSHTWSSVVNCGVKSGFPSNLLWSCPQSHGHVISSPKVTSEEYGGRS
jgi:hypothetical protein